MDPSGGREGFRVQVLRGIGLLITVVGMLTVGILGPGAFTPGAVAAAVGALVTASESASLAPLLAVGLLVAGVGLAAGAEFGPFGRIDASVMPDTAPCRICDHAIDPDRGECPYCHTADPVEGD